MRSRFFDAKQYDISGRILWENAVFTLKASDERRFAAPSPATAAEPQLDMKKFDITFENVASIIAAADGKPMRNVSENAPFCICLPSFFVPSFLTDLFFNAFFENSI